ncbi:histidinol-phosphatase [Listeria fleischmannii 1991]|uniref:Histidinol-phosphatase n=2 Tax=Listeria fleischmannii TaxID=1069827 RepID=A0A2X3J261_9LIST|nr:histidinol-phosphatase HisJ [Listeria fleischmannii]EMG28503.1 histidinol-phosphatase [Listeria fleischmannii subsp. fleischmannii LU2006-1]KMT59255.1 histidinol-phosphatase [Listeria fleischmannii 1991]SQC67149.1 Histidinol-phosphatase [Listeria fleischmannii subsp. fleischmannii]
MKRDGHTHTEFCPHGSREEVERFIIRAIELDFDTYSITEHMPLPANFNQKAAGDREAYETASMAMSDLPYYLKEMARLKEKYKSDIQIKIGFEVDYLAQFEAFTRDFLNEYGSQLDDGILSVHFLEGKDGIRSVDFSASDYETGIVEFYGGFREAQTAYLEQIKASILADLGPFKPKRLGHISLCQKFRHAFQTETALPEETMMTLLELVQRGGYALDYNTAGLYKPDCLETYPPEKYIKQAKRLGIPLVYGSDSHAVSDVGRAYSVFAENLS